MRRPRIQTRAFLFPVLLGILSTLAHPGVASATDPGPIFADGVGPGFEYVGDGVYVNAEGAVVYAGSAGLASLITQTANQIAWRDGISTDYPDFAAFQRERLSRRHHRLVDLLATLGDAPSGPKALPPQYPCGITEARLRADAWATISDPACWNSCLRLPLRRRALGFRVRRRLRGTRRRRMSGGVSGA